jgi:hypothetical protein
MKIDEPTLDSVVAARAIEWLQDPLPRGVYVN